MDDKGSEEIYEKPKTAVSGLGHLLNGPLMQLRKDSIASNSKLEGAKRVQGSPAELSSRRTGSRSSPGNRRSKKGPIHIEKIEQKKLAAVTNIIKTEEDLAG